MDPFELTKKTKQGVNVDIAPLMDMVFILLIFFIVTSTFTRETGVEVEKPKAKSATELNQANRHNAGIGGHLFCHFPNRKSRPRVTRRRICRIKIL